MSDFYLASKVSKIDGRSLLFPKQVPTLFDFGMSWSHLSASEHTFFRKCHTSQRFDQLFSDLDGKRTSNASQTHQFCELEPGQHDTCIYIYSYICIHAHVSCIFMDVSIASAASPAHTHPSRKESTKGGAARSAASPLCGGGAKRRPLSGWMCVGW